MKTVRMKRDFTYRATPRVHVQYMGDTEYRRVPEAAAKAILAASAGEVVDDA